MPEADLINRTAQLDRRQFVAMAALATAAGSGIAAPAAQALEAAGPSPPNLRKATATPGTGG
jgi:hypothetical protein